MEEIKLTPVESSTIKSIGYHNNDLYVKFNSDIMYKYLNVPNDLFEAFKNSDSKGRFMNESIKNNFKYERLN